MKCGGNCLGWHLEIAKKYPNAIAFYDGNHVISKIGDRFYDKYGEYKKNLSSFSELNDKTAINLLSEANDNAIMQNGVIIPSSKNGLYDYPKQMVLVPTDNGNITMKDIDYPVIAFSDNGEKQLMMPNNEYKFKGKNILEIPILR